MLEPKLSIRTLITKVIFEWMFLIQAMCKTTHMHNMWSVVYNCLATYFNSNITFYFLSIYFISGFKSSELYSNLDVRQQDSTVMQSYMYYTIVQWITLHREGWSISLVYLKLSFVIVLPSWENWYHLSKLLLIRFYLCCHFFFIN